VQTILYSKERDETGKGYLLNINKCVHDTTKKKCGKHSSVLAELISTTGHKVFGIYKVFLLHPPVPFVLSK
jgi:hypothetical protein